MATLATRLAAPSLTPPQSRDALTAECLLAILAGRPFPEGIAPHAHTAPTVATAREGIERILGGAAGGQLQ
jgi:hypothetical protein